MLYEMNDKSLTGIERTSFQEQGVVEATLQEALREHPEFIEDGLFVISDEFSDWEDAWRYIDLLCIDSEGNLVVVELKRGDGVHMELQAIRYAAMVANSTTQRIVEGHRRYLAKWNINDSTEERIRRHLGLGVDDEISIATEHPRIVLVSEDFNREITTSVLWLNEMGLNIACVRVRAYRHEGKLLLDIDQVIPLPEAEDYLVTARSREQEVRTRAQDQDYERIPDMSKFEAAVESLSNEQQRNFEPIMQFAKKLEAEGLARFESYSHKIGGGASLRLLLRNRKVHLAVLGSDSGAARIYLYRPYFERHSAGTSERVWAAFGVQPPDKQETWVYGPFPDGALEALYEAYRVANES